jgi:hypothetical protein
VTLWASGPPSLSITRRQSTKNIGLITSHVDLRLGLT